MSLPSLYSPNAPPAAPPYNPLRAQSQQGPSPWSLPTSSPFSYQHFLNAASGPPTLPPTTHTGYPIPSQPSTTQLGVGDPWSGVSGNQSAHTYNTPFGPASHWNQTSQYGSPPTYLANNTVGPPSSAPESVPYQNHWGYPDSNSTLGGPLWFQAVPFQPGYPDQPFIQYILPSEDSHSYYGVPYLGTPPPYSSLIWGPDRPMYALGSKTPTDAPATKPELELDDLVSQPYRVYPKEESPSPGYLPFEQANPYDITPVLAGLSTVRSSTAGRTWSPSDPHAYQWQSRRGYGHGPMVSHWPLSQRGTERPESPKRLSIWSRLMGKRQKNQGVNSSGRGSGGNELPDAHWLCSQSDLDYASRPRWGRARRPSTSTRAPSTLPTDKPHTDLQRRLVTSVIPLASSAARMNFYDEASEWARDKTSTPESTAEAEALLSGDPSALRELAGEVDVFYDARNRVPMDGREALGYI